MTLAWWLFAAHVAVALFGAAGLAIAVPRPELWADGAGALLFGLGMRHGGALQNILGAAAMVAFGVACLGARRTLVFFAAATSITLVAELIGTATGYPFGAYAYTTGLGAKVSGRVPWTIPLSWFFMGFASYLIGRAFAVRAGRADSALAVGVGALLLTAWDFALDPAMSHPAQPVRFWHWGATGPYLGIPLANFAGWLATGWTFMAVAHAAWPRLEREPPLSLPLGVYLANVGFACLLCAAAGFALPIALVLALGAAPALAIAAGAVAGRTAARRGLPT